MGPNRGRIIRSGRGWLYMLPWYEVFDGCYDGSPFTVPYRARELRAADRPCNEQVEFERVAARVGAAA